MFRFAGLLIVLVVTIAAEEFTEWVGDKLYPPKCACTRRDSARYFTIEQYHPFLDNREGVVYCVGCNQTETKPQTWQVRKNFVVRKKQSDLIRDRLPARLLMYLD